MSNGITIRRKPQSEKQAFIAWFVAACVKSGWSRQISKANAKIAWDRKEPRAWSQFQQLRAASAADATKAID